MSLLPMQIVPPAGYHEWTRQEQLLYVLRGANALARRCLDEERAWVTISELCNPAFCLHTVAQAAIVLRRKGFDIKQEFRPRLGDPEHKISCWRLFEDVQPRLL